MVNFFIVSEVFRDKGPTAGLDLVSCIIVDKLVEIVLFLGVEL